MALQNTYVCKKCGYTAVSAGRRVNGMMSVTAPYICEDCTELTDIIIGTHGEEFANLPAYTPSSEFDQDLFDSAYKCDNCGSGNVKKWHERKRPCPKCGAKMMRQRAEQPVEGTEGDAG